MQIFSLEQFAWKAKAYFLLKKKKEEKNHQFVVCWICQERSNG